MNITSSQPLVMVEMAFFPFATVSDGCKDLNFMGVSHEYGILNTIALKVLQFFNRPGVAGAVLQTAS